ncbi:lytic transglycosylase domain-containing protein [Sinimarinibacterium sp. NLF-5-8]|uniref:lytic transglycosylase domain-containing protein n=1 Tax=Sinimarinibacterium sp. NLF-5-8 TaxID=2698684 RepID=UPI00137BCBBC|nr:lytic transglycosylase domain-containing protein [Sinimarinibacterium sp. NLF-5-8]QHS08998.1 lytic transglycosylase domain-containing protein [Sinimarinibacterium sp. NLF-5-8]
MAMDLPPNIPACIAKASSIYQVPEALIKAIMHVESHGKPDARNINKNGSEDLGLMQINSIWLPELKKYRITRAKLLNNSCLNVAVGTWIFSGYYKQFGDYTRAIRAYNAGPNNPKGGYAYARKVILQWHYYHNLRYNKQVTAPQRTRVVLADPIVATPIE